MEPGSERNSTADLPVMPAQSERGWREILRRGLFERPKTTPENGFWFAGLVVEPTDFGSQLMRLNNAIEKANTASSVGSD